MIESLLLNTDLKERVCRSLTLEGFNSCIHRALNSSYEEVKVSFYNHQGAFSDDKCIQEIKEFNELLDMTKGGGSICVTNIQMCHPSLAKILLDLNLEKLNIKKYGMNCYLSQDGFGADLHTDGKYVNSIQVLGKKKWRVADRPVDHPLAVSQNGEYKDGLLSFELETIRVEKESRDLKEIILGEGDSLSLKPGTLHSAEAIGLSLAVNLYCVQ